MDERNRWAEPIWYVVARQSYGLSVFSGPYTDRGEAVDAADNARKSGGDDAEFTIADIRFSSDCRGE